MASDRVKPETRIAPVPEPGEFYYDGPYMVFTEAYHLRRGWCCQSGCRHCPYGFQWLDGAATPGETGGEDGGPATG